LIEAADIHKAFGGKVVLDGVSFSVAGQDIACFIGRNGCGKSTLLNLISGFLPPDTGTIMIDAGKKIGYAPQADVLFDELSVGDNLLFWAAAGGVNKKALKDNECIAALGVWEFKKKKVRHLSQGMKRRVSVAIAILKDPDIIILDEPFSGLDIHYKTSLTGQLLKLNSLGKTIIYTSHSADETFNLAGKIFLIEGGKIAFSGTQEDSSSLFEKILRGSL